MKNINYKRGKPAFNKLITKIAYIFIDFYSYIKLNKLNTKVKEIKGKVPNRGGFLIAPHHEEWVDVLVIKRSIKRRLNWIAATEVYMKNLVKYRFFKKLISLIGIVSIDTERPERNKGFFDYVTYLLKIGEAVVIFPEGNLRIERDNKRLGKAKDGVIRIAQFAQKRIDRNIPIYPIGLEYKRKDGIKEACMRIGAPFFVEDKDNPKKAMARLMKEIAKLSHIRNRQDT